MYELKENIERLRPLFIAEETSFIFESMKAGNTPVRVFVDNPDELSVSLVWDKWHCFYFVGEASDESKYRHAANFFKGMFLQDSSEIKVGVAKINFSSENWYKILSEELKEFKPDTYGRSFFRHDLQKVQVFEARDPEVTIREIDVEMLGNKSLENIEALRNEATGMWGTTEKFLESGFGYCALKGQEIISWCTAEYVSEGLCGFGIETIEKYQRRGIAAAVASRMVEKCSRLNIVPHWDSWKANAPSVRIAEKVGFTRVADYRVLFINTKER